MQDKTILVTGAAGYVGAVLCRQLLAEGYRVRGLDNLLFGGNSLLEILPDPRFEFVKADLRTTEDVQEALVSVDAVVHLAAIVGDPACKQFPREASDLMNTASKALFEASREAGVRHFVFASTCSNYGVMKADQLLTEEGALHPQSHYARLKVAYEEFLMAQTDGPQWTILRFATAYGYSPRPRFDLTVNHFTRDMTLGKELLVFGQHLWRPYCHVFDLAASVQRVLSAGYDKAGHRVYNVGDSAENYTKAAIVKEIHQLVPGAPVRFGDDTGGDLRNYRVDFSRIAADLGFAVSRRLPDGVKEFHKLILSDLLADPFSAQYRNT